MNEGSDWRWTGDVAAELRVGAIGLRDACDCLGVELREHPRKPRQRVMHRDDVFAVAALIEAAKQNRARRNGR